MQAEDQGSGHVDAMLGSGSSLTQGLTKNSSSYFDLQFLQRAKARAGSSRRYGTAVLQTKTYAANTKLTKDTLLQLVSVGQHQEKNYVRGDFLLTSI